MAEKKRLFVPARDPKTGRPGYIDTATGRFHEGPMPDALPTASAPASVQFLGGDQKPKGRPAPAMTSAAPKGKTPGGPSLLRASPPPRELNVSRLQPGFAPGFVPGTPPVLPPRPGTGPASWTTGRAQMSGQDPDSPFPASPVKKPGGTAPGTPQAKPGPPMSLNDRLNAEDEQRRNALERQAEARRAQEAAARRNLWVPVPIPVGAGGESVGVNIPLPFHRQEEATVGSPAGEPERPQVVTPRPPAQGAQPGPGNAQPAEGEDRFGPIPQFDGSREDNELIKARFVRAYPNADPRSIGIGRDGSVFYRTRGFGPDGMRTGDQVRYDPRTMLPVDDRRSETARIEAEIRKQLQGRIPPGIPIYVNARSGYFQIQGDIRRRFSDFGPYETQRAPSGGRAGSGGGYRGQPQRDPGWNPFQFGAPILGNPRYALPTAPAPPSPSTRRRRSSSDTGKPPASLPPPPGGYAVASLALKSALPFATDPASWLAQERAKRRKFGVALKQMVERGDLVLTSRCHDVLQAKMAAAGREIGVALPALKGVHTVSGCYAAKAYGMLPDGGAKALDPEGSRVGGYGVRFGSPDEADISEFRDFFTKNTDYWLDQWTRRPLLYHHAQEDATKQRPVIGVLDTAILDDYGLWLEGDRDLSYPFAAEIKAMLMAGELDFSTDSAPHLIERQAARCGTHEIKRWPVIAASLTPTPAEPRLSPVKTVLSVKTLQAACKAIGVDLPWLDGPDENPAAAAAPDTQGEDTMGLSATDAVQIARLIYTRKCATPAVKSHEFAWPEVRTPANGGGGDTPAYDYGAEHRNFEGTGLPRAVVERSNSHAYIKAFEAFLRLDRDIPPQMRAELMAVKAAMNETTTTQGSFMVPIQYNKELITQLTEESYFRKIGVKTTNMTSKTQEIIRRVDSAAATWVAEATAFTEVEPTIAKITLTANKMQRLSLASSEVIEDAYHDVWRDILLPDFGQSFSVAENDAFIAGTGSGQPEGVTVGGTLGKTFAGTATITFDELQDLFHALPYLHRNSKMCYWFMRDATAQIIRKLKDGDSKYYWEQNPKEDQPLILFGKKVIISNSVAAAATTAKSVIFGDFNDYRIGERQETTIKRLEELYAASDQIGWRAYRRLDGRVVQATSFQFGQQA